MVCNCIPNVVVHLNNFTYVPNARLVLFQPRRQVMPRRFPLMVVVDSLGRKLCIIQTNWLCFIYSGRPLNYKQNEHLVNIVKII